MSDQDTSGSEQLGCEVCGISIENELNLCPIEYKGKTVQACPGCHGAAGGGQ